IDYFQNRVKKLPRHVIAAAVAAQTQPFSVVLDPQTRFPALQHSCTSSNGTFGDPGVRLKQVIDSFGDLGTYISICQDSYAGAMAVIANLIGQHLGRQCIAGILADKAANFENAINAPSPGVVIDPDSVACTVDDVVNLGTSMQKQAGTLRPCKTTGEPPG